MRIAVLASGGGSNLQALIDRFGSAGDAPARVELVVGSRPGIGALDRAAAAGIAHRALSPRELGGEAFSRGLEGVLLDARIDLVVLAGWLQLIPHPVVERFEDRIINIHPALLPSFGGKGMYGMHVHRAVLASGARVTGATVHRVDAEYDRGRILAQWPVPVLPDDTPERIAARVLAVEHRLLPAVVERLAGGVEDARAADPISFALASTPAPSEEAVRALVVPST